MVHITNVLTFKTLHFTHTNIPTCFSVYFPSQNIPLVFSPQHYQTGHHNGKVFLVFEVRNSNIYIYIYIFEFLYIYIYI